MNIKINPFTRRDKKGKLNRVKSFSRRLKKKAKSFSNQRKKEKIIGEGWSARVVDSGFGTVRKELKLSSRIKRSITKKDEASVQRRAASIGIAPKIYRTSKDGSKITMEKVSGETVEDRLAKIKNTKAEKRIGYKTGKAVRKLHDAQIQHNDPHLRNIYSVKTVLPKEKIKIIDYGLAKSKNRPLTKIERFTDNSRVYTESLKYPKFREGYTEGYGKV